MDLETPEGRLAAIVSLGTEAYNSAMRERIAQQVVRVVAGRELRAISSQFGRLIAVGSTRTAFSTMEEAEKFARENPAESDGT